MRSTETNILKSSDVRVEGKFHLDVDTPKARPSRQTNQGLAAPQVRILENHPEYAVLEHTCACGHKSHIRCNYQMQQPTTDYPQQN